MGLTFLDFFAGIGGFRLGMQQAGHIPVGWVEWDKFARKSYEAIHNPEGEWTEHDIRSVDYRRLPRADIWTFGFPCQDISVAGNQKGFDGERSSLFFSVTRLLRQTKEWDTKRLPSYLFIENVKNFLSVNDGWDFLAAQIELDEIGYECEWDVLNSKDFGVPQNRERVFIIGHLRGRSTREVFPLRDSYTGAIEKPDNIIVLQKTHGATTTLKYGETGTLQAARLDKIPCVIDHGKVKMREDSLTTCIPATYYKGLDNHGARTGIVEVRPVLTPDREEKRQQGRRFKEPGEPAFTVNTIDRHGVAIQEDETFRIRKLTPRECFRLQGFPDWAFDRAASVNSDSQLYKQAGNSVSVPVIEAIAKQFEIVI